MKKSYVINNYNLKLNDRILLSNFSMCLQPTEFVCLLGESGSGKSLLLKDLIAHQKEFNFEGKTEFYLGETKNIKNYKTEFLYDNLSHEWQAFLNWFLENSQNYSLRAAIVSKLLTKPDFLFCEDLHQYFKKEELEKLFIFIKSQHIGVFYVTNSVEDTIYFDYLIVIKNNHIAMEGKTLLVLKEEKLMKLLGFSLPFYVNLSIQLGYYGLLTELCTSKEELEEKLWPLK